MVGLLVGFFQFKCVHGVGISATKTIYTSSSDGYILNKSASYANANAALTGATNDTATSSKIGQFNGTTYCEIWRTYLYFDFAGQFPSDATPTNGILTLNILTDLSTTDFNVTIQNGQPTYPHDRMATGDYNEAWYSDDGGSNSTATIASNQLNITVTATGLGWLDLTGEGKLCLRSDLDIGDSTPTYSPQYIHIYTVETGVGKQASLTLTYTYEGQQIILHGPYYENGTNATVNIRVLVTPIYDSPYFIYLNGTDGNADTVTIDTSLAAITWNISAIGNNETRTYYFLDPYFEEVWLLLPDAGENYRVYTVTITDLVGMTNAYLETVIYVSGNPVVIERQALTNIDIAQFYMTVGHIYNLLLICDQGSYSWLYQLAEDTLNWEKIVNPLMFPSTATSGLNVTVSATRLNTTTIEVLYSDSDNATAWLNVTFKYKQNMPYAWITAYSTNNTGSIQTIVWNGADSTTDYMVWITNSKNGVQETWILPASIFTVPTSVWSSLDSLWPDCPIPASQLIGFAIVMFMFGIFSYANISAGCVMAVLTAGVLVAIGMLNISTTALTWAMVFAIFIALSEAKKVEREI